MRLDTNNIDYFLACLKSLYGRKAYTEDDFCIYIPDYKTFPRKKKKHYKKLIRQLINFRERK